MSPRAQGAHAGDGRLPQFGGDLTQSEIESASVRATGACLYDRGPARKQTVSIIVLPACVAVIGITPLLIDGVARAAFLLGFALRLLSCSFGICLPGQWRRDWGSPVGMLIIHAEEFRDRYGNSPWPECLRCLDSGLIAFYQLMGNGGHL